MVHSSGCGLAHVGQNVAVDARGERNVRVHKIAKGRYWASTEDGMLVFGIGPTY